MKTRKKKGGIFNYGTHRLRSRLRSRLKNLRKKKSRKISIPKNREVSPKKEANSQSSQPEKPRSKKTPPKRITPKKSELYKPIQVVEVEVIGEDGKPISMSQNCISITKEYKKESALLEILYEVVEKNKDKKILQDILDIKLDINLDDNTKNHSNFILLTRIIEILKKQLGFLGRFIYSVEDLKKKYNSLNDNNLKKILQNLKEEIKK